MPDGKSPGVLDNPTSRAHGTKNCRISCQPYLPTFISHHLYAVTTTLVQRSEELQISLMNESCRSRSLPAEISILRNLDWARSTTLVMLTELDMCFIACLSAAGADWRHVGCSSRQSTHGRSSTPRKRYTVALGEFIMKPHFPTSVRSVQMVPTTRKNRITSTERSAA